MKFVTICYLISLPLQLLSQGSLPVPNQKQIAWQEAEVGTLISYDLHVFDQKRYNQGENRISPMYDYQIFHPDHLDTDQWIRAVKDAGMTFAILTVTHETGFALYQSDVNPYCMKALKYQDGKGDIFRDFVNSCRKYGIKPGVYVGIRWNSLMGVHNFQVNGEGTFRENRQLYYNHMMEGMVTELCTRYGELFEIWFDGGADHPDNGAPDVLPIVQKYQPNCLFYHNLQLAEARWGGSESGTVEYPCWATFPNPYSHGGDTPEEWFNLLKHGDSNGKWWMPAMSDAPLRGYNGRHEWFWEPGDEAFLYPVEGLMNMYEKSVGRNSTLILGLTPDDQGLIPEQDVRRLKEWGDEIHRRFANPLGTKSGVGKEVTLKLNNKQTLNQLIIQEDISKGERIRKYRVEARVNGRWAKVCSGESVGHKRIQQFEEVITNTIRLIIDDAVAVPVISNFSVYHFDPMPDEQISFYVGSYANSPEEGITLCTINRKTGEISEKLVVGGIPNPSFLTTDRNGRFLFAANEVNDFGGLGGGAVTSFSINPETGQLIKINSQSSGGDHPCHLALDQTGRFLAVANYSSGSIAILPVSDDGSVGVPLQTIQHQGFSVISDRQSEPHAHSVTFSPDNRFLIACDLGIDRIMVYRFNYLDGKLEPATEPFFKTAPGAGPRHFTFSTNGKEAFVINELNSTLVRFDFNQGEGGLNPLQTISTLPEDFLENNWCADVHLHSNQRFLYGSNRGLNSIAVFTRDNGNGDFQLIQNQSTGGQFPRNFALVPGGDFLIAANQNSDNLVVFRIDRKSGKLSKTGYSLEMTKPVCIRFK